MTVVGGKIHVVNALHDGAKRRPVVNFEGGAIEQELAGVGETGKFVEAFDGVADGIEELSPVERDKITPRDTVPTCRKKCGCISYPGWRAVRLFR